MAEDRPAAAKPQKTDSQRIADLELALAQTRAGLPGGTTPYHGAGPGTETAETWSQAEQEAEQRADAENA